MSPAAARRSALAAHLDGPVDWAAEFAANVRDLEAMVEAATARAPRRLS